MAASKQPTSSSNAQTWNFGFNSSQNPKPSSSSSKSSLHSNSAFGSFFDDQNGIFQSNDDSKTQNFGGFDDLLFRGPGKSTNQSNLFDYDSIFLNYWNGKPSTAPIYGVDDVFGGMPSSKCSASAPNNDDVFVSFASMSKQSAPIEVPRCLLQLLPQCIFFSFFFSYFFLFSFNSELKKKIKKHKTASFWWF